MKISVFGPDFRGYHKALLENMKVASMNAAAKAARRVEKEIEAATVAGGLSKRISRTWYSKVYPENGKVSLTPGAQVWSRAPGPMLAFTEGAVIRGKGGGFLAIPTAEVLKVRGRDIGGGNRNQRITPGGFTRATGIKLHLIKGHGSLGFLIGERAVGGGTGANTGRRGGFRAATSGRLRRGARLEKFLAFVLVPSVTIQKKFDTQQILQRWGAYYGAEMQVELTRAVASTNAAEVAVQALQRPSSSR